MRRSLRIKNNSWVISQEDIAAIKKIDDKEVDVDNTSMNLYLIGTITNEMSEKIITNLLESERLEELDTINLYISSEGGDLYACFAMIDLILHLKNILDLTINTFGLGEICSGGFFMFLLGDNRAIFPKCRVFVHEHMCQGDPDLPFTEKVAEFREERILNKLYVDYVADQLDIKSTKAKKLLEKNKWLNKKELDEYNIVTGKIE